jgi:thiosulfate dehydrogenase
VTPERSSVLRGVAAGVVALALIEGLALYLSIVLGLVPANADGRPSRFERWAARTSLLATLRREASGLTNPLPVTGAVLLAGVKIYAADCATCHGDATGRPTLVGFGLYQFAPTLGRYGVEDNPEAVIYWKITHGIRFTGMPSFARTLSDEQRWQVTTFLKHMNALPPAPNSAWHAVHVTAVPASLLPPRRMRPGRAQ